MKKHVLPAFRHGFLAVFLCACSGFVSGNTGQGSLPSDDAILSRIDEAYHLGEIDLETALLNKAFALFEPARLAEEFSVASPQPMKCGTPVVLEIRSAWEQLGLSARSTLSPYFQRPSTQHTFGSPSGHFKIHYDTSGLNAVYQPARDTDPFDGVPDYVNRCAEIFDLCWAMEIDSLGYDSPPSDKTNGGDDRYDVYLQHTEGAYGVTFPENPSSQYPDRADWSSYIYVDPTYDGFGYTDRIDPLSVTAAHEFFHAVQFAYDTWAETWIMESSAVWMEEYVYDDVNDYRNYLSSFFSAPEISLDASVPELHPYGSCVWSFFLAEHFGADIIRQTWERITSLHSLSAVHAVLEEYGSSLEKAFHEFTVWNYLTKSRANGSLPQYEEAAYFPDMSMAKTYTLYPVLERTVAHEKLPSHLGSNYVRCAGNGAPGELKVLFEGDAGFAWDVSVVADSAGTFISHEMHLERGRGFTRIPNWQFMDEVVFIPCVGSTSGGPAEYFFSVLVVPAGEPSFRMESVRMDTTLAGNGDKYIDPGERIGLVLTLENVGLNASHVTVVLSTPDPDVFIEKGDAAFGDIDENGVADNGLDPFIVLIREQAGIHRADCVLTLFSNDGLDTSHVSFLLTIGHPTVLLVDDDFAVVPEPETYDVEEFYESSLDSIDEVYDYWSVEGQGSPDSTFLRSFRTVIWFTGYAAPSLSSDDQRQLAAFLEAGGRLFITGQEIAKELHSSSFLTRYLHAGYVSDQSDQGIVYGVPGDPISGDFVFFSTMGSPGANNQVSPDVIAPLDGASVVFTYSPPAYQAAGIKYDGGSYRIVFCSFGFEGIVNLQGNTETMRSQVLDHVLGWLNFEPRKADVTADGRIDVTDMVRTAQIILEITPLPDDYELWASDCDGGGLVNVLDIVGIGNVILGLGGCEE